MFKKLWDAICLTMGVSTAEGDAEPPDKWAAQREKADQIEAERKAKIRAQYGDADDGGAPDDGGDE